MIKDLDFSFSPNSMYNMFNIEFKDGKYTLLCNKTLTIIGSDKASSRIYESYKIEKTDSWASIAYREYKDTDLWWVVCKFNGITNPLNSLVEGKIIKIPNKSVVDTIINSVRGY